MCERYMISRFLQAPNWGLDCNPGARSPQPHQPGRLFSFYFQIFFFWHRNHFHKALFMFLPAHSRSFLSHLFPFMKEVSSYICNLFGPYIWISYWETYYRFFLKKTKNKWRLCVHSIDENTLILFGLKFRQLMA